MVVVDNILWIAVIAMACVLSILVPSVIGCHIYRHRRKRMRPTPLPRQSDGVHPPLVIPPEVLAELKTRNDELT